MLIKFFKEIQKKPKKTRIKIMWTSVIICSLIIFFAWLFFFFPSSKSSSGDKKIKEEIGKLKENLTQEMPNFNIGDLINEMVQKNSNVDKESDSQNTEHPRLPMEE